ncbi:MAG TPA: superoxide dismutase family protein [Phycisphaerae bacterium]|nr:superoxide dismutase family protein [Phycisphaerales bacterium]HRX84047.1 superoxide dismutase family protein [Phycisphaerae bacterium]
MRNAHVVVVGGLLAALALLPGCQNAKGCWGCKQGKACKKSAMKGCAKIDSAVCVLEPTQGNNVHGVIHFERMGQKVKVTGRVEGLTPGKHGFHVHEYGDITAADGKSAGGHFNPTHEEHGRPQDAVRHVGDLGNIEAGADGVANVNIVDNVISLGCPHCILGRGLVVHAGEDHFTQPTGDAGARVAVGVIGVANPSSGG